MSDILANISRLDHSEGWISWQKDDPLFALKPVEEISQASEQSTQVPSTLVNVPILNRSQYKSVVQQFHRAAKNATQFSTWMDT